MTKKVFPGPPGGPLAKGIVSHGLLFLSGQVAGPEGGDRIETQVRGTLDNIAKALEECGSSIERVVKATIYMTDLSDKSVMNQIYQEFFEANLPARTTVAVSDLGSGVLIEIDIVAEVD